MNKQSEIKYNFQIAKMFHCHIPFYKHFKKIVFGCLVGAVLLLYTIYSLYNIQNIIILTIIFIITFFAQFYLIKTFMMNQKASDLYINRTDQLVKYIPYPNSSDKQNSISLDLDPIKELRIQIKNNSDFLGKLDRIYTPTYQDIENLYLEHKRLSLKSILTTN